MVKSISSGENPQFDPKNYDHHSEVYRSPFVDLLSRGNSSDPPCHFDCLIFQFGGFL